jgi:hypothetical protein
MTERQYATAVIFRRCCQFETIVREEPSLAIVSTSEAFSRGHRINGVGFFNSRLREMRKDPS